MLRHLNPVFRVMSRLASGVWFSPRTSVVLAGLGLGFGAWVFVQNFMVALGFTYETSTALLAAISVALVAGRMIARRFPALAGTGLATIVAAACLALLPSLTDIALGALDGLPADFLRNPWLRLVCLTAAALFMAGPAAACGAILVSHPAYRRDTASLGLAIAGGSLFAALIAGPIVGLTTPAFAVAGLTGLGWMIRQWFGTGVLSGAGSHARPEARVRVTRSLITLAIMVAAGISVGLLARVLAQLMPEAPYLIAAGGAALLAAIVAGNAWRRRWLRDRQELAGNWPLVGAIIIACGVLLPLVLFEPLVSLQLNTNAYVSSLALVVAIRVAMVAVFLLPVGLGLGLGGHVLRGESEGGMGNSAAFCGGLAAAMWLIPITGIPVLAFAMAGSLIVLNLPAVSLAARWRWRTRLGMAVGISLCVTLGLFAGRYAPTRAAQLLFDANVLISWRRGVPERLLTVLDDTRLTSWRETRYGTLTTWRSRGSASSTRLNGIPMALTADETDLCPLPAAEVLRLLLPIALHDDPESLLLLSDPAGLATEAALRFPLRRISSYDEIAFGAVGHHALVDRPEDGRVTVSGLDPRLAVLVEDRTYDLVVSSPGHPAAFDNAAYFTQEFYAEAAGCLTPDGIFCQRVRFSDFGPEPLRVIAGTMGRVFGEVIAVELGGGEIALLGTLEEATIIREGVVERMQRPQMRRVLADLGWDWSMPFNLQVISADQLREFARESSPNNTAMSGYLAHGLPYEMMRWGPKSAELRQATSAITAPLVAVAAPADEQREILARIKVVARQHEMMRRYPDQPWAYRKAVRKHLKDSPRSVIEKVDGNYARVLHPEEERRLDYFKALGVAIRELDEPALAELESFAEPYDPLISYFLHHEIAPLYAQLGAEGLTRELSHRLHAAYFADPGDRSIRNIVASIHLLVEHPDAVSSPMERFDQLNGLVEMLLTRWETRGAGVPQSPEVALVDVDKSLDALVKALPVMAKLAPQAEIDAEQWKNRSDAIERMLTRPLRKYRTTLLPHVRTAKQNGEEKKTAEAVPQAELPL